MLNPLSTMPICSQGVFGYYRAPKDHINIRILQVIISGILSILGLRTRMDPYVHVVFWAPTLGGGDHSQTASQQNQPLSKPGTTPPDAATWAGQRLGGLLGTW